MSLPAGVYGVLMFFVALAFGFLIRGRRAAGPDAAAGASPAGDAAPTRAAAQEAVPPPE
jgi:BASS family bile acid:Na+ symporter